MTKTIAKIILILQFLAFIQGGLSSIFDVDTSIVNGEHAAAGEIPYQISLHQNGQHNCGGSVVNENYVLTAAHCVSRSFPQSLSIIAGTVNLDNMNRGASKHKVTSIKVHEQYNEGDSWRNDLALLRVEPPFTFSANLAPAQLPGPGETLSEKQPAIVSGFGLTSNNGVISRNLLKTNVYIDSNKNCQMKYLLNRIYPTNVCTVNLNKPTGFCRGDSGGPLSVGGIVVGVVSYSLNNGCAAVASEPQVYTRVSEYINWITSNMQGNNNYPPPPNQENTENTNDGVTENNNNNNNNNNNGITNPTNDFTDWINSQDHNNPNWVNDLNNKYEEWLQSTG